MATYFSAGSNNDPCHNINRPSQVLLDADEGAKRRGDTVRKNHQSGAIEHSGPRVSLVGGTLVCEPGQHRLAGWLTHWGKEGRGGEGSMEGRESGVLRPSCRRCCCVLDLGFLAGTCRRCSPPRSSRNGGVVMQILSHREAEKESTLTIEKTPSFSGLGHPPPELAATLF
jgi:hypothetical protein